MEYICKLFEYLVERGTEILLTKMREFSFMQQVPIENH